MAKLTVTYGLLRDGNFHRALGKLMNCSKFPPKVGYNIARIERRLRKELTACDELFTKTVKQYAILDEKGEFVPLEVEDKEGKKTPRPGTYQIIPEKQDAWIKAQKEFSAIEVSIESYALTETDLSFVELTPIEIDLLGPLVDWDAPQMPLELQQAMASAQPTQ